MNFSFTDEQQQLRRTVREFAASEIAPHVMEWDETSQFPSELIPKLAEMGLMGVIFPGTAAAPVLATSNTRRLSRNCRALTDRSD